MIWLYTPAFIGLAEINRPTEVPENEAVIDCTIPRTFIQLHDPEYLQSITKPSRIILKRSLNDTVRTYVTYDRKATNHHDITLKFDHLTTNRMMALEQFLRNTEGQNIGYKTPRDNYAGCLLLNPETVITTDQPDITWDQDGQEVISEWGNVELKLRIIKGDSL